MLASTPTSAAAGTATSGSPPRPTWRPSRRRSRGRRRSARSDLSASTARPTPSASPSGTVISASLNVTHSAFWNSTAAEHVDVLVPARSNGSCSPWMSQRWLPRNDRPDQRIDDEHAEHDDRRCEHQHRQPATAANAAVGCRVRTPRGHVRRGRDRPSWRAAPTQREIGPPRCRAGRVASVSDAIPDHAAPAARRRSRSRRARPARGSRRRSPASTHGTYWTDEITGAPARATNCSPPTPSHAGRRTHGDGRTRRIAMKKASQAASVASLVALATALAAAAVKVSRRRLNRRSRAASAAPCARLEAVGSQRRPLRGDEGPRHRHRRPSGGPSSTSSSRSAPPRTSPSSSAR